MQMHQIRYFLALCEERNFTRAAKRSGVSQPSLTNGIITLERELGGALFQRKPTIALTALGYAMQPYLARIAENADHAQRAAQALADRRAANGESGETKIIRCTGHEGLLPFCSALPLPEVCRPKRRKTSIETVA